MRPSNAKTMHGRGDGIDLSARAEARESALLRAGQFLRAFWVRIALISAAVLAPCYWHRRIEAGDLASHMYNAWLAQLIERGQVSGLWIARQWNNVLFDLLVGGIGKIFNLHATEKIAVAIAVLLFFWGVFALVCAATERAPWFLVPVIAMISYGYTFHMGFFNYYLSLGLSFFGLAIFWKGKGWERLIPVALAPLIMLAHPLGLAWLAGAAAYIALAELMPARYQPVLLIAAGASLAFVHYYFWHHYVVQAQDLPFYQFNGADQLILFGPRYQIPEIALICFALFALAMDVATRRAEQGVWAKYAIPFQLYAVVLLAAMLLPEGIRFHPDVALALLTERLTSVSAAVFCCVLGVMRPRKWHLIGFAAIAAVFFTFVYQDTATLNGIEVQAERLVRTLPPDQRILATIKRFDGSRIIIQHIADRACIGYCFSYGNYEPGSGEFRVRALPGNAYVMPQYDTVVDMEDGSYEVQPEDLPAYQLYQCSASGKNLCIRALEAGEDNDRLGAHAHDE